MVAATGTPPPAETTGWLPDILYWLFADPGTYIPEIIGLVILLLLGYRLLARGKVIHFLKTGDPG